MANDTIDLTVQEEWSKAYYLYRAFMPVLPSSINLTTIVMMGLGVMPTLQNKTQEQQSSIILAVVNGILATNMTADALFIKIGAAVSMETGCS